MGLLFAHKRKNSNCADISAEKRKPKHECLSSPSGSLKCT